jgi:hypothetical protein
MATDALSEAKALGFEPRDVSAPGLLYFLVIVGVFLVITSLAIIGLFAHYRKTDQPRAVVQPLFGNARPLPPPPRLQAAPGYDIQQYHDTENKFLNSSAWIDQNNGVARIPIDRAMALLLQQGLPVATQKAANTKVDQVTQVTSPSHHQNNRPQEQP